MVGRSESHKISSLTQIVVFWNNWSKTRPSHCFWISRNKSYFMFLKRFIKITILQYHVLHYTSSLVTDLQRTFVLSSTPLISLISWFCFLCCTSLHIVVYLQIFLPLNFPWSSLLQQVCCGCALHCVFDKLSDDMTVLKCSIETLELHFN